MAPTNSGNGWPWHISNQVNKTSWKHSIEKGHTNPCGVVSCPILLRQYATPHLQMTDFRTQIFHHSYVAGCFERHCFTIVTFKE